MRPCSSNSCQALATLDWFGIVNMRIQRPSRRSALTALNDCEPPETCMTASVRPWVGRIAPLIQRQVIDLRLHQAGHRAMPFGAAPDLAFGPFRELAQFADGGMIVAGDLVGKRQVRRIEDACLARRNSCSRRAASSVARRENERARSDP